MQLKLNIKITSLAYLLLSGFACAEPSFMVADLSPGTFPRFVPLPAPTATAAVPTAPASTAGKSLKIVRPEKNVPEAATDAAPTSAGPRFMRLDRTKLVPVRVRPISVVVPPYKIGLQPLTRPAHTVSPATAATIPVPTQRTPMAASGASLLDLFDNHTAPLPQPNSFYKALRANR